MVALPSEDASLYMRHLQPENLTRSVERLIAYASQGLAHTSSTPQVPSPVFILQLFEWEFSLMKVKELFLRASLILPLARGQSQGRGHPLSFLLCPLTSTILWRNKPLYKWLWSAVYLPRLHGNLCPDLPKSNFWLRWIESIFLMCEILLIRREKD